MAADGASGGGSGIAALVALAGIGGAGYFGKTAADKVWSALAGPFMQAPNGPRCMHT